MPWEDLIYEHLQGSQPDGKLAEIRGAVIRRLHGAEGRPPEEDVEKEVNHELLKRFQKSVKDRLLRSLSSVYWDCLTEHLLSQPERVPAKAIFQGLAIAPSNQGRSKKKETTIDASKFFVVLLGWKVDAREIGLSRDLKKIVARGGHARCVFDPVFIGNIARLGVKRLIEQLRAELLVATADEDVDEDPDEEVPDRPMEPVDLTCAGLLWRHHDKDILLEKSSPDHEAKRSRLHHDVLRELQRRHPGDLSLEEDREGKKKVEEVEREWLLAYGLYWFGRPPVLPRSDKGKAWEVIYEEAEK